MKSTTPLLCLFLAAGSLNGQSIEPFGIVSSADYFDQSAQGLHLHSNMGQFASAYLEEEQLGLSQGILQAFVDLVPTEDPYVSGLAIQLGPNPCTDVLTLRQNLQLPLAVEIWDAYGRCLRRLPFESSKLSIPMNGFPAGTYFLRCERADQQVFRTVKIIKL